MSLLKAVDHTTCAHRSNTFERCEASHKSGKGHTFSTGLEQTGPLDREGECIDCTIKAEKAQDAMERAVARQEESAASAPVDAHGDRWETKRSKQRRNAQLDIGMSSVGQGRTQQSPSIGAKHQRANKHSHDAWKAEDLQRRSFGPLISDKVKGKREQVAKLTNQFEHLRSDGNVEGPEEFSDSQHGSTEDKAKASRPTSRHVRPGTGKRHGAQPSTNQEKANVLASTTWASLVTAPKTPGDQRASIEQNESPFGATTLRPSRPTRASGLELTPMRMSAACRAEGKASATTFSVDSKEDFPRLGGPAYVVPIRQLAREADAPDGPAKSGASTLLNTVQQQAPKGYPLRRNEDKQASSRQHDASAYVGRPLRRHGGRPVTPLPQDDEKSAGMAGQWRDGAGWNKRQAVKEERTDVVSAFIQGRQEAIKEHYEAGLKEQKATQAREECGECASPG